MAIDRHTDIRPRQRGLGGWGGWPVACEFSLPAQDRVSSHRLGFRADLCDARRHGRSGEGAHETTARSIASTIRCSQRNNSTEMALKIDPCRVRFTPDWLVAWVKPVRWSVPTVELPMAHVALAWVLRNPVITAPIVGATKPHHLDDAVKALDVMLNDNEVAELEQPYRPHLPSAF